MSLTCPGCGAPVRWKGNHPVVECRYCGTHVATGSGQKTDAPAQVVSKMRPRTLLLAYGSAGLFTALMVGVSVLGAVLMQPGAVLGPSAQEVASLSMATTIGQVSEATGSEGYSETSVCVYYSGGVFDYVCLTWDPGIPDHVQSFSFHSHDETNPGAAAVPEALRTVLGRRLVTARDGAYSWSWAGTWLNADADMTWISVTSDPASDPGWRTRISLLWATVFGATLDRATGLDEVTARQWIGVGYRPLALATLDLTMDVDQAGDQVTATVPGAVESRWSGLTFTVPLDHPQLGDLELSWTDTAGGHVDGIDFSAPPGMTVFPDQAALRACIEEAFGEAQSHDLSHLEGTSYQLWNPEGLRNIYLYPGHLTVEAWSWDGSPPSNGTWTRLLRALDACQ